MAKVKHIKLTLKPKYHADVIAILEGIEPSKVAATVIEALRVWKSENWSPSDRENTPRPKPVVELAPVAEPDPVATTPVAPAATSRSKVNLNVGFDALND